MLDTTVKRVAFSGTDPLNTTVVSSDMHDILYPACCFVLFRRPLKGPVLAQHCAKIDKGILEIIFFSAYPFLFSHKIERIKQAIQLPE